MTLINIDRAECRKILALVVLGFVVSHARRKQMRKRWLGKPWVAKKANGTDKETAEIEPTKIVDHPFVPFLIENLYLFVAPLVFHKLGTVDPEKPLTTLTTFVARNAAIVIGGLTFQRICAENLYSHVPYFTNTKPSAGISDVVWDYLRCNFTLDLWMAGLQLFLIGKYTTPESRAARANVPFKVGPFLGKLFVSRIVVDITFYLAHRWLHTDFGYKTIHFRHHEHTAPRLQTNFHFFSTDLFMEAVLPFLVNVAVLNKLGFTVSGSEEALLAHYLFYFEAGSHTGKEIPVVTWFPPLSPLVDAVTGFDQRLIEYHTRHHQFFNCNYSISPWPDKLMGSYQMEYKVKDSAEKQEY